MLDCQIEVYACLFILHFLPRTVLGPERRFIMRSNASPYVNWAHCGISRLVPSVDMLLFFCQKSKDYTYMKKSSFYDCFMCLSKYIWGKKSIFQPALILIFWQCAILHLCSGLPLINFSTMCYLTRMFVPPLLFGSSEYCNTTVAG